MSQAASQTMPSAHSARHKAGAQAALFGLPALGILTRPHIVLIGYLMLVFAMGGGARDDVTSLVILRPVSIGVLGYALVIADPARLRANRVLLWLAGAWTALVALHLVPLPPQVWHALPGRELAIEIDRAAGLADQWRPLSLVPYRTLNALLSLTVPLAALALAVNLTRSQLKLTAMALVALVGLSALLSLLQTIGTPGNPFYLYRITNHDAAVGLFANRNHNAIFLALGIMWLGACAALHRPAKDLRAIWPILLGGAALTLLPFLIMTGSRAGVGLGVLALIGFWWLKRLEPRGRRAQPSRSILNPAVIAGALGAGALAGLTAMLTVGNAFTRLAQSGGADDGLRLLIWPSTWELVWQHFPVGSGIGTFVEVYEVAEPSSTLGPSYINHAHNDWLEVALTGGAPALALLAVGAMWLSLKGLRELRTAQGTDRTLRMAGILTLVVLMLGSLYDYPLRTPSLAITFILALVWIAGSAPHSSPDEDAKEASASGDSAKEGV